MDNDSDEKRKISECLAMIKEKSLSVFEKKVKEVNWTDGQK